MGSVVSKLKSSESQDNVYHQALRNELILENICSSLNFEDLKRFRMVNQNWNRTALLPMRKVCSLNVTDVRKVIQRHLQSERKWNANTAERFVSGHSYADLMKYAVECSKALTKLISNNSNCFPCLTFCLGTELCVDPSFFNEMLGAIAPFVRELDLEIGKPLSQCNITNLDFPNLTTLRIDECIREEQYANLEPECFQHILQASPKLTTVHLTIVGDSKRVESYIKAMAHSQCLKIENLHLYMDIQGAHLSMLQEVQVTLRELKISMGFDSELASGSVKAFLENQKGSLEKLELEWLWVTRQPLAVTFPRMQKIHFLKLGIDNYLYPGLCYKDMFPCLKHLVIGDSNHFVYNEIEQALNSSMQPLNTVQILEFGQRLDKPKIIHEAARIFPNLTNLTVCGSKVVLKAVGYAMTKLEVLTLIEWLGDTDLTRINFVGYLQRKLGNDYRLWNGVGDLVFETNKNNTTFFQSLKILRNKIEKITELGQIKPISSKNMNRRATSVMLQRLLQ